MSQACERVFHNHNWVSLESIHFTATVNFCDNESLGTNLRREDAVQSKLDTSYETQNTFHVKKAIIPQLRLRLKPRSRTRTSFIRTL